MRTRTPLTAPGHRWLALLGAAALLAGCSDESPPLAPEQGDDGPVFTSSTTLPAIEAAATAAPVRIEVKLFGGGPPWIAREVELEADDGDEEKLESRIVAADESAGTITLALGDLTVALDRVARFRTEGSSSVGRDAFFARVETALANGRRPGVELRRPVPAEPQAPSDPDFRPTDVRLDDEADEDRLEITVDGRHVTVTGTGSGALTILGIEVVVDATTEIEEENEEAAGETEIEGLVESVDLVGRSVTLVDGDVIRLVDGTVVDDSDDDDTLRSLEEVEEALAGGAFVEAEAEALLESSGVWIAIEIEFEIEDDADDVPGVVEFEGIVTEVDVDAGTLGLGSGTELSITPATRIDDDGDLFSLEEVAEALAAGLEVEAEGHGVEVQQAVPGIMVLDLKLEADDDGDDGDDDEDDEDDEEGTEFEGEVSAADPSAGTFTLTSGGTFDVTAETTFDAEGDLLSLQEVADALAADRPVRAEGRFVEDDGVSSGRRVLSVKFETDD